MKKYTDDQLAAWLQDSPAAGPAEALERALGVTRHTSQRPSWLVALTGGTIRTRGASLGLGGAGDRRAVTLLVAVALVTAMLAGAMAVGFGLLRLSILPPRPSPPVTVESVAPLESPASTPRVTIGRFVPAGSLVEGRAWHSALALLDGRVLLVGGEGSHVEHAGKALDSMEVWDPIGGAFTASDQMQRATYGDQDSGPYLFRMIDGRSLLIPAGCVCGPAPSSTPAQVWDPVSGAQPLENLLVQRVAYTATQLSNGNILIAGGVPGLIGDAITAAEVWDPVADAIEPTGLLAHARNDAVATLLNDGRVLILGGAVRLGDDADVTPILEAEIWNEASGTFSTAFTFEIGPGYSSTRDQRLYALTLKDGRVLVLDEAGARVWDPVANTLSEAGTFREARRDFSATLLADGRVLLAGGSQDIPGDGRSVIASTEIWSPSRLGFEPGPELTEARAGHTATLLSDGRVLIVGGFRTAGLALDALASAELWEPVEAGGQ